MNGLKVQNQTDRNLDTAKANSHPQPLFFYIFLVNLVFFRSKKFDESVLARSITKCKILYY